MSKHTPGPWSVHDLGSLGAYGEDGPGVCAETGPGTCQPLVEFCGPANVSEVHANALLIAAAPDLLEALYSILNIEGAALFGGGSSFYEGLDVPWHFAKVRAAIAKAEGED